MSDRRMNGNEAAHELFARRLSLDKDLNAMPKVSIIGSV
jgi:hypothetical protein